MIRNRKEHRSASVAQTVVAGRSSNEYTVADVVKLVGKRKATVLASTVVNHTLPLLSSVRQPKFL